DDVHRRADELLAALRLVDREDRLDRLDVERDRELRRAQGIARLRGDDDDRLPDERDLLLGEQQLVLDDRAEAVVVEVAMREERDDAVDAPRRIEVDGADAPVRDRRPDEVDEELAARGRHVVDVDRLAADVAARGIVGEVLANRGHGNDKYTHRKTEESMKRALLCIALLLLAFPAMAETPEGYERLVL